MNGTDKDDLAVCLAPRPALGDVLAIKLMPALGDVLAIKLMPALGDVLAIKLMPQPFMTPTAGVGANHSLCLYPL
jgi:hypothetical protein